ncbi:MAG: metallophosphoesterase [Lachnospiraceae bacterium]|nr:metallophosphoesterase [Lachnospiraceae bacterium]
MHKKFTKLAALSCASILLVTNSAVAFAAEGTAVPTEVSLARQAELYYEFTGNDSGKAGYAQGNLYLYSPVDASYNLYWSDNTGALGRYYPIASLKAGAGETAVFQFEYHTAIPADATKVIAVNAASTEYPTVSNAAAVFDIPAGKQLGYSSADALYTFNSFSDIHIDEEHFGETPAYWWEYSEAHWAQALAYAANLGVDFIVSSGDQVTNAKLANLDKEWQAYQLILAQSDYVNPIYESGGNHEVRQDDNVPLELQMFINGSGLNGSIDTIAAAKPYYSVTEPTTGDLFIFMALEGGYRPAKYDEFTTEQLDWVENLLRENYGKGKNIYLIQHALIKGYGPGDDLETPYYSGSVDPELPSAQRFISLLEAYPDIVWISGHSHEDFALDYNFTDNNGTSCSMIHNPSAGNPTHVTDGAIDYAFNENLSQGYYVQTFKTAVIFNGANLCDQKMYPAYTYIIDGNTSVKKQENKPVTLEKDVEVTPGTLRSVLANVNTVLGIYYEFSSYDQYQALKKCYYEYKDMDTNAMTEAERLTAYSRLKSSIAELYQIAEALR